MFYPDKRFGFLEHSEGGRVRRIHYHENDVRRDWRGSVAHAATEGATVSFLIDVDTQGRLCAVDVVGDFIEPQQDLTEYCEVSRVESFNGRFGLLERPDGGTKLFLHKDEVIRNHDAGIKVGDFVFNQVRIAGEDRCGRPNWIAHNIELYSPEEQARLQQGLPAQEPVPEILSPANRNKKLFDLIKERKWSRG